MIGQIVAKRLPNKSNDARKGNFFIVLSSSISPRTFYQTLYSPKGLLNSVFAEINVLEIRPQSLIHRNVSIVTKMN